MKKLLLMVVTGLIMSFSVYAEDKDLLTSKMDAYVVETNKKGEEELVKAEKVYPKDKIEYKLTYTNNTEKPLKGLVITGPIPENTFYVADTSNTKIKSKFVVSIDGGKTFESEPVKREIMKDGKKVEIIIPPEKYTAVRWIPLIPINAKEKQIFAYRIEVK
ncbi:DUF11 domain-containing protein [Photobacterium phosphoreum]|jgi:uncharacterized repeat protein (TIGR01451 family)|uniref:DUF11 domain-containing protein n=1 Tax=Photobacterium phosphoreum TaxID=659 RepID=A0A2T3JK44_PHOPO|nr:DUF11 domain-containing protein [Photobacterium phosphoreum]KJF87477.1 hypothetical protein UB41_06530 [Photobacterium phosphoreum]MCD9461995.1 DUF11 domain-containing protein [Photobacterium phosphoreum]MCD9469444.1 DUF11 domain-containing protein [Photobacterium phosphoreum]MCD9475180.1 DUF11 domain-containing protein [Photobacterium phosphoreum]MCD9478998.1 DUF11 domain-containing protein [Photobacterium phosphoreum]